MQTSEPYTLKLPFLGSLENGEPFEYVLLSLNADLAEIAILQWFLNRTQLHIGDKIDLHLSNQLNLKSEQRGTLTGEVTTAKHSEKDGGELYQIALSHGKCKSENHYTEQTQATESLTELYIHLIKDSMILKAGIIVYFKHLIPYFSRIAGFSPKEYDNLKKYFLHDLEKRIQDNETKLKDLYRIAKENIKKPEELAIYIDLESLRETIESEISVSVFNIVFSSKKVPTLSDYNNPQMGIFMYINAIKNLEKRLYSNYNQIVLIYLKSFG
jgi:hypothetical protein